MDDTEKIELIKKVLSEDGYESEQYLSIIRTILGDKFEMPDYTDEQNVEKIKKVFED